jgi:hypothetical protein
MVSAIQVKSPFSHKALLGLTIAVDSLMVFVFEVKKE